MADMSDVTLDDKYLVKEAPLSIHYVPNYITEERAEYLLKQVYSAPQPKWTQLAHRRLQNWGGLPHPKGMIQENLPKWLNDLTVDVARFTGGAFSGKAPNHVLVNEYKPGEGIMPHEDGPLYHPVVTTVSLGSHTLLDFYSQIADDTTNENSCLESRYKFSLLLEPCSLLVLQKDMYIHYLHGIAEREDDVIEDNNIINLPYCQSRYGGGERLIRSTRVSLTIRHVPKTIRMRIGR